MHQTGFIRTVILLVVALLIAAYFGFDLNEYLSAEDAEAIAIRIWETILRPVYIFIAGIVEWIINLFK